MKRATTIIREINNLEKELFSRFSSKEICDAIEKEEKKKNFYRSTDGLISVIYEGAYNDIILDEEFPDN